MCLQAYISILVLSPRTCDTRLPGYSGSGTRGSSTSRLRFFRILFIYLYFHLTPRATAKQARKGQKAVREGRRFSPILLLQDTPACRRRRRRNRSDKVPSRELSPRSLSPGRTRAPSAITRYEFPCSTLQRSTTAATVIAAAAVTTRPPAEDVNENVNF